MNPITVSPAELEAAHQAGRLRWPVDKLSAKALDIRRDIITLLTRSQTGHSGGPLSCTDFGTALFFHELSIDPKNPDWAERDFWNFSIGHVTPVIYSLMAERGYFPLKDLMKFRAFDGHAQGHPSRHDTPGIEVSAGSLGQGLSVACGVAKAAKIDGHSRRVYCVMGDGEQQEGQIWEAAMFAAHYRLDNLCGIIDYNRKQIDGDVEDIMGIKPLDAKWRAFNWNVIDCNGHDIPDVLRAFGEARAFKGRPSVILAHTAMGQGVSYMTDDYRWHGKPPKPEQGDEALKEMGTSYAEWSERLLNH
ncbi:MAG: transketolase [Candidatus Eisenbacteria bacterium]